MKYETREYFNQEHYTKVYRARKRLGLPCEHTIELKDHTYIGTEIYKGEEYAIIDKVVKQWHHGWYIGLLLNFGGSHCFIFWQNINCTDELILKKIKETKQKYKID